MKSLMKDSVLLLFGIALAFLIPIQAKQYIVNTMYTITGIMFSIGIGLVVTFNLNGVKNRDFILIFRRRLLSLRNTYIRYFGYATLAYLVYQHLEDRNWLVTYHLIEVNWSILLLYIILISFLFNIFNFVSIQKLGDELYDRLNEL